MSKPSQVQRVIPDIRQAFQEFVSLMHTIHEASMKDKLQV